MNILQLDALKCYLNSIQLVGFVLCVKPLASDTTVLAKAISYNML